MKEFIEASQFSERTVLVGLITPEVSETQAEEYLDELAFLSLTAGAAPIARFLQHLDTPNPTTFIGKGKLDEIAKYVSSHEIGLAIFDDELAPNQLRNIENRLGIRILDRTSLILDIFATRAQTAHAKTQVEMAQYQYMLPRLTKLWTHLERQRGGSIGLRGPGETQLETDRRIILRKISQLRDQLKKIDRQKSVQRQNRGKMVRVALAGYTNVGKSTLMNVLAKSDIFAENKLFATLDTTVRKVILSNLPFLLADTVGFIRKLPTQLVESFKSTLDEVREADLILHVVDISHPEFEDQILIFNKIDAYQCIPKDPDDLTPATKLNRTREELQATWMGRMGEDCIFVSVRTGEGINELRRLLYERVKAIHIQRYPYNDFLYPDYSDLADYGTE